MIKKISVLLLFISGFLYSQSKMPIMAFNGVKTGKVVDFERFKKAGFNISLDVYHSTSDMIKNLNAASKVGVKLFVYSDSLITYPKNIIDRIKNHPAYYGVYVADEPPVGDFPKLKWRIYGVREQDKYSNVYVNLFPNYASKQQLGANSYLDYLSKFVEEVPIDFISFDFYPISRDGINPYWYQNLEDIRKISLKINKPFWGVANSTVFGNHNQTTIEELRLQQFGNLLYGAKGLQYFTYFTLDKEFRIKNNFKHSIVYEDGSPSPTYKIVKQVNEQIHSLADIFLNTTVSGVFHDGKVIPLGTEKLGFIPKFFKSFNKTKNDLLISMLESTNEQYVIVQNKSLVDDISLDFQLNKGVLILNNYGKTITDKFKKNYIILPGDILIFKSRKL